MKPKLAIIGRPNVGKSALFNRILKKRISIVDEAEGITRDRLYADGDCFGQPFTLIDTGGIHSNSQNIFNEEVMWQAEIAINEADSLVLVVDGQVGLTDLDQLVAEKLLRSKKPLLLAVNKVDDIQKEEMLVPFYSLGIKNIIGVSAIHGWNIAELLEEALKPIDPSQVSEEAPGAHIAIVGKPNVGKSSLLNYLLDEDRCIVSPIPGTTRDRIDVPIVVNDIPYVLIDTAGIRRKKAEKEVVDKFAYIRTEEALERTDLCLLMVDAKEGLSQQDKRIIGIIEEEGKPCVILLNKWDLVKDVRMEHTIQGLNMENPFVEHCPKVVISVEKGRNIEKIFPLINEVLKSSEERLKTHDLNTFVEKAIQKQAPPAINGKRLRIYYMTQISSTPPTFVLFINYKNLMRLSYQRYLSNQLRKKYGFKGYPIRLILKEKERAKRV
ncbi:ribosome biogenesis GTPase Der [Chlamydiales bacterium]|nr:ribosome biogenesis GTPase Der [Chlamydiales bacterium]